MMLFKTFKLLTGMLADAVQQYLVENNFPSEQKGNFCSAEETDNQLLSDKRIWKTAREKRQI